MPRSVRVAATIWIVIGVLTVIMSGLSFILGRVSGFAIGTLVIAVAFTLVGAQQLAGKPMDTLGNAIGSFLIAAIQIRFLVTAIGSAHWFALITGVAGAGAMIAAGVLALSGRTAYKAWRMREPERS